VTKFVDVYCVCCDAGIVLDSIKAVAVTVIYYASED